MVHALEEHYDKEISDYRERHPQAMMPGEAQVPSGEEISDAFENYLTAIEDRDRVLGQDEQQLSLPFGDDENNLLMDHFLIDPEDPADPEKPDDDE